MIWLDRPFPQISPAVWRGDRLGVRWLLRGPCRRRVRDGRKSPEIMPEADRRQVQFHAHPGSVHFPDPAASENIPHNLIYSNPILF